MSKEKTCCFTGHRPKGFPWNGDPDDPRQKALIAELDRCISFAISNGYNHFICGNALGVDTWAAEILLKKKEQHPNIRLEIAIPFEGHNKGLWGKDALLQEEIHTKADELAIVTRGVDIKTAFHLRNRYMVDHSSMLIAVFDERSGAAGGTAATLSYAKQKGLDIQQIRWMDLQLQTNSAFIICN